MNFEFKPEFSFPSPETADENGIVAIGGDLYPDRLLAAYSSGIFPWPHDGLPMLWFSPDPRMVLHPAELRVPRSLRKVIDRCEFEIRLDTAFVRVVAGCADSPRPGQDGTWITPEMAFAYSELHRLGFAHSAEAWRDGELVGGLYGVSLGAAFFGESMFARVSDASKAAFVVLAKQLAAWGFTLIDAQVHTEHLERFGAEEIPRREYLLRLKTALETPTRRGKWNLD